MNIDQLCDLAKKRAGLTSDRELARRLAVSAGAVNFYRSKRTWPSEDTIIKLAELAEIDAAEAIIELNIWRSKGPEADIYRDILIRLKQTAAAFFLAFIVGIAGQGYVSDAQAKTALTRPVSADAVYIMENIV